MDDVMIMRCRGGALENSHCAAAMDHQHHQQQQQKIPIWIGSECKVLSGVSKLTTCSDIIQLLITDEDDPSHFVIVEKWRKMERKLDPNVRILKVWKEWGDQKNDVALILRQYHSSSSSTSFSAPTASAMINDGYIDKRGCSSNRVLRRKSAANLHHNKTSSSSAAAAGAGAGALGSNALYAAAVGGGGGACEMTNGNHVERSGGGGCSKDDVQVTESMERILSLVLTQGETIQAQLKKLRHQEEQIERYEEQMHRIRSLKDGENYVVDSYLSDVVAAAAGGGTTSTMPSSRGLFGRGGGRGGCNTSNNNLKKRDKTSKKLSSKGKCKDKTNGAAQKKRSSNGSKGSMIDGCRLLEQLNPKVQTVDDLVDESSTDPQSASLEESLVHSETLMQQNEMMERICQVNGELTKEEERLVKLGLKIRKYQQQSASKNRVEGGGDDDSSDNDDEDEEEDDDDEADDDRIRDANCHHHHHQHHRHHHANGGSEQERFASQLSLELESLRQITAEQSFEIEQNELHLTEIESILDEKHDCIVHLTYEIQLLDVESDMLQQRLLQITKPMQNHQQQQQQHEEHCDIVSSGEHHTQHSPHHSLSSQTTSTTISATAQQRFVLQPPPYDQAINSSMLANYLLPLHQPTDTYRTHSYDQVIKSSAAAISDNQDNDDDDDDGVSVETGVVETSESNATKRSSAIPDAAVTCPSVRTAAASTPATAPAPEPTQSCRSTLSKMVPTITCNPNYCQCPQSVVMTNNNNNGSSTTTPPTTNTTDLSLHSSSSSNSRDHQDNDSNSDTGISSLHSSGDENTLFALDTLV